MTNKYLFGILATLVMLAGCTGNIAAEDTIQLGAIFMLTGESAN